jgi:hypothetical protein
MHARLSAIPTCLPRLPLAESKHERALRFAASAAAAVTGFCAIALISVGTVLLELA